MPRLPKALTDAYADGTGTLPPAAWKPYRTLRAVLANAGGDGNRFPHSILVTSGGPGDGKTFTAVNLAIAQPDLASSFKEFNRFFNMLAYNPGGTQKLTGTAAGRKLAMAG